MNPGEVPTGQSNKLGDFWRCSLDEKSNAWTDGAGKTKRTKSTRALWATVGSIRWLEGLLTSARLKRHLWFCKRFLVQTNGGGKKIWETPPFATPKPWVTGGRGRFRETFWTQGCPGASFSQSRGVLVFVFEGGFICYVCFSFTIDYFRVWFAWL